jgi:Rps23 Pro-64 3,4-dihydroxylase Tpa1-like proline 4-hydroxylase
MISRIEKIEGKKIYVIDDYMEESEINSFYDFAVSLPYKRSEKSTNYDEFPKFVANLNIETFKGTFIEKKSKELFSKFYAEIENYNLFRVYINLSNYGDVEWPHRDCPKGRGDITILYYINREWHYKYGGETLFYSNKEPFYSVVPKPGRFVLFEGDIEHIGGLPNRICKLSRYTLAIKYIRNEFEEKNN